MRKHQRKLINEVSVLYQSNDPLKWVFIAQRFGSSRPITPREQKLLAKRIVKWTKQAVKTATKAIQQFGITMNEAAKNMRKFTEAFNKSQESES